jgi:hypothetical protein
VNYVWNGSWQEANGQETTGRSNRRRKVADRVERDQERKRFGDVPASRPSSVSVLSLEGCRTEEAWLSQLT